MLVEKGTAALETGGHASDLIRRPQLTYQDLAPFDTERPPLADEVTEQVEIQIKYEGYIQKQLMQVEQMRKLEDYNNEVEKTHPWMPSAYNKKEN